MSKFVLQNMENSNTQSHQINTKLSSPNWATQTYVVSSVFEKLWSLLWAKWGYGEHKYSYIYIYRPGTPNNQFFNGCFNRMIPNHDIKNGCFTKHPLKDSCLGYQAYMYMYCMWVNQLNVACDTAIQSYTLLYYTILSYPVLYLYHTIPYHTILCYTVLHCYISTVVGFQTHLNNIHLMLIVSSIIRVKNSTKKQKNMGFCRPCFSWLENKLQGSFQSTFLLPKTSNPVT